MTLGLVLTIIFLALRYVVHATDWPLWVCFLPVIIEGGIELLLGLLWITGLVAVGTFLRRVFVRSSR